MAHAKEEVEFYVLTSDEKTALLNLVGNNSVFEANFVQFVETGTQIWCIRADFVRGWDNDGVPGPDLTEENLFEFNMQTFIMSTMHQLPTY